MRWICVFLAVLCAACGPGEKNRPADTIIVNGKIFTAVPGAGDAQALAIRDGRILAVGTDKEVRAHAGKKTAVINAKGRRVVPGLTDAHVHISAYPDGTWLDLGGGPTPNPDPAAILAAVKKEAANPEGKGWIYAAIGAAALDDKSFRREALDKASPARPVMLEAWSGHGTIMNSRALTTLGVNEDFDPPGGWCERNDDGKCTGLLREMAEYAARRKLRMSAGLSKTAAAYRKAADAFLRWGVTAIGEMDLSYTVERTASALADAGVQLRWSIYRTPMLKASLDEAWSKDYSHLPMPNNVRLAGIKWLLDGTPIERGAALREDYADRKGWSGRLNFTSEQLHRILKEGLARNEQLALHTSGDRTAEAVLRTMRDVAPPEKWRAYRLRIEHGDGLERDLFKLAKDLGVVVIQNPMHFLAIPQVVNHLTKDQRASQQLIKSFLKEGIPLAIGSDAGGGPSSNPYLNIMVAVTHPLNPTQGITVRQALTAYTSGGAYAQKEDKDRGTLEPGKLADLAILSQDILDIPLKQLPATKSVLTMIGGKTVYDEDAASAKTAGK